MLFGMTEQTPNADTERQANTAKQAAERTNADKLRFVPPVAALGTAFVLQVIVITDTVGEALANRTPSADWDWTGYLFAVLLGVAVASCAEGGAAYLMDLYDRHLLARDSVWVLRLAMVGYVAASGFVIHWWTDHRGLPAVVSWLLAGMSASALFLWSRGSRWRNREAMRAAGQLDPAMPRLSVQAKMLHPLRYLVTLWLVSWEPVETTEEARGRYRQWKDQRTARRQAKRSPGRKPHTAQTPATVKPERPAAPARQTTPDVQSQTDATQTPPADAQPSATVRPIESARRAKRTNTETTEQERANIERLKNAFEDWRTNMPSVRSITNLISGSNYTGQKYQGLLAAERANEQRATHTTQREPNDAKEDATGARPVAHAG